MKRFVFVVAGVLVLAAFPTASQARVEADPNKEYIITPEAGPFAICVKSFIGADAHELANQLTLHLRQNGWPAYVFDYTAEERRKAQEWIEARYHDVPPEARPHKTIHVEPQWAVFIGGYRDFDSASHDLAKLKKAPEPPAPKGVLNVELVDPMNGRLYQLSAYAQCMATRNPTVPMQKRDPNAPDPSWKNLNDGRPYNLLTKCGKPWTLVVAQFRGTGVIQPRSTTDKVLGMVGLGGKSGDMLEASAAQAEEIARVLREGFKPVDGSPALKFDAYVLHTRTGSIVTVGGYDRMDDPRMLQVAEKLKNMHFGMSAEAIKLFEKPMPMKVPQL
jgi:hypothetical protein